jgi:8-oxo-dGTP pyrophosphatase MutT (NUDIX family)
MTIPIFKNIPNECTTTTDGRTIWLSRSVAVVMVLVAYRANDDKFYIAIEKRGTAPGLDKQGLWCLPCGYLDFSESGPEAVKRELWEEIGINLDDYCKFDNDTQPWFVKTAPDENRQNVTLRYAKVLEVTELPKLIPNNDAEPNEVADAKWTTLDQLGNYEFAFNHDTVIQQFFSDKRRLET